MNEEDYSDPMIPQGRVVDMVKLLGHVAGMTSDLNVRRRALMQGVADMLDADAWVWTGPRVLAKDKRPIPINVMAHGLPQAAIDAMINASVAEKVQPPEDGPLCDLVVRGQHFTRTRQQLVPDDQWYNHPTTQKCRLQHGFDHFIYSIYPLDPHCCSALGFLRQTGRSPFNDLDRRICHVIVGNIEWLHKSIFPEHKAEACETLLTPRQRAVLVHLLQGYQRDDIANVLHISTETVKVHIRNIYRHFNLNSQVELMHHFASGNGRDVA